MIENPINFFSNGEFFHQNQAAQNDHLPIYLPIGVFCLAIPSHTSVTNTHNFIHITQQIGCYTSQYH